MAIGHAFNFDGGAMLTKMSASWFVSYSYYNYVDASHKNWCNPKFSVLSVSSRKSRYNMSTHYHKYWLERILEMEQLDKNKNKCGLDSKTLKNMAKAILAII